MTVFYSHRLSVIDYVLFNSLFNKTLVKRLVSEKILSKSKLKEIEVLLKRSENDLKKLNLTKDLRLDFYAICAWLQSISNKLMSQNLYFYLKNELQTEIDTATLTVAMAHKKIVTVYAETLLNKGKKLINNSNYNFNTFSVRQAIEKTLTGNEDEKLPQMPLYFNEDYFILEHGSRKLIEPQVLQEMFLQRYFSILKTYIDAKILDEASVKQAFAAKI